MAKKWKNGPIDIEDAPIVDTEPPVIEDAPAPEYHEPVYTVPSRSSLNCRAGIVEGGKVVTPEMVIGGLDTLEHLVSVGGLIKE
jgi:hypothetical protein